MPEPESTPDENTPEWFRSTIERTRTENAELRGQLKSLTFETVGIDTSKGRGLTMFEMYDGEASPDALRAWASEKFEWTPPGTPEPGLTAEQSAAQQVIAEGQERIEAATTGAQSVVPPPAGTIEELRQKAAAAEEAGDMAASISYKRQWTEQLGKQQRT